MEATRILADDFESIGSEMTNDFFGVRFSDAAYEAATKIFANTVDGGGELRFELGDFKLIAVLRVARPFAV